MAIAQVERALREIGAGRMVVLVDDESRENEGDLCMAADAVTAQDINFMATHGRGLICLTLTAERLQALQVPMMVPDNTSSFGTNFTVSIEARTGVTTGISAADRARTIAVAVADDSAPDDLARPGHIFPLRARAGGVLCRDGQTEGSVDLARLAKRKPAGVICEILREDGTMMRLTELRAFAQTHGICVVSVADLIAYRLATERLVHKRATRRVVHPEHGELQLSAYETSFDGHAHLLVERGPAAGVSQLAVGQWPDSAQALTGSGAVAPELDALLEQHASLWRAESATLVLVGGDAGPTPPLWAQLMDPASPAVPQPPAPTDAIVPHRPQSGRAPSDVAGNTSLARRRQGVTAALLRESGRLDVKPAMPLGRGLLDDLALGGIRLAAGAWSESHGQQAPQGADGPAPQNAHTGAGSARTHRGDAS